MFQRDIQSPASWLSPSKSLDSRIGLVWPRKEGAGGRQEVPRDLPIETASCVYRITQEALRNVAKHAGNATVEVTLKGTSDGLELSIRDNGKGFDAASGCAKEGLGLIGMEERVRLVGGTFTVESAPGHGVAIVIRVPSRGEAV